MNLLERCDRLVCISSRHYRYAANCSYGMMVECCNAGNWRLAQSDRLRACSNSATYHSECTYSWFRHQMWRVANACEHACHSSYLAFRLPHAWLLTSPTPLAWAESDA